LLCKVLVQSKFGTRVHVKRLASLVVIRISDLLWGENRVLGRYYNSKNTNYCIKSLKYCAFSPTLKIGHVRK